MKPLTKKQQLLLLGGIIVFSLIYYFGFMKRKLVILEESGYDSSWINIGDDFFIPNSSSAELVKKYIDGTISNGIKIDSSGNCDCGTERETRIPHGIPNQPGFWIKTIKKRDSIPYPKDKGFTKSDGRGNYFYFEPLSDLQMAEINRLQQLKADADQAAKIAAQAEADRIAAQQAAQNQANAAAAQQAAAAKALAEQKIAVAKAAQAKADAQIAAANQKTAEMATQNIAKNKKIVVTVLVILIVIVIITASIWYYKKNKKA